MYDCSVQHAPLAHKFTGKEHDSESGLDNFEARYDASSMGRLMTPDPLGGHQEDPQTLNRHAYVRNNPLNLTDPTGLDFYLNCDKNNGTTCQGGHEYYEDKDGDNQETVVKSDDKGNLTDQSGNKYSGTVESGGVHFAQQGSDTSSTGSWVNGSSDTKFTQTSGVLSGFSFDFSQPGQGQTLRGTASFSMSETDAATALGNAGFYSRWQDNAGNFLHGIPWGLHEHFRTPGIPAAGHQIAAYRSALLAPRVRYSSAFARFHLDLGHRPADSTRIYAKVDMPALREVADLDLGCGLSEVG